MAVAVQELVTPDVNQELAAAEDRILDAVAEQETPAPFAVRESWDWLDLSEAAVFALAQEMLGIRVGRRMHWSRDHYATDSDEARKRNSYMSRFKPVRHAGLWAGTVLGIPYIGADGISKPLWKFAVEELDALVQSEGAKEEGHRRARVRAEKLLGLCQEHGAKHVYQLSKQVLDQAVKELS